MTQPLWINLKNKYIREPHHITGLWGNASLNYAKVLLLLLSRVSRV